MDLVVNGHADDAKTATSIQWGFVRRVKSFQAISIFDQLLMETFGFARDLISFPMWPGAAANDSREVVPVRALQNPPVATVPL